MINLVKKHPYVTAASIGVLIIATGMAGRYGIWDGVIALGIGVVALSTAVSTSE